MKCIDHALCKVFIEEAKEVGEEEREENIPTEPELWYLLLCCNGGKMKLTKR